MACKNVLESVREDDFVEYYLFPTEESLDPQKQEEHLWNILKRAETLCTQLTKDHLWHKDKFSLTVRTKHHNLLKEEHGINSEHLPPHLYGVTHFGENLDDEWLIVYLIMELSKQIPEIVARVCDSDGEMLLIEAANHLPNWANPESCERRVYIHQGNVHLIPLEEAEETLDGEKICAREALEAIVRDPTVTSASAAIQTCIRAKISEFPRKIQENLHRVTAYVPVGVAAILRHNPNLISAAIQAFCNRDPVDLKYCKAMKYFPPENRVYTTVTFTRCMYAMLTHSQYAPDRRIGWNLPKTDSPQFKSHYLGVKIASGFEILASQAKPGLGLDEDKNWTKYLANLQAKDYFQGLLEHSKEYNRLLDMAKEYYVEHRDSMRCTPKIGAEILNLTKTLDYKVDELKRDEGSLAADESEDWLNISVEDLDKMLQERYGGDFATINNNSDAGSFTAKISNFLENMSGIEGVEHPAESPQRPPRGVKRNKVSFAEDTKSEQSKQNNRINFDPNAFSCAVQNILNFVIPEDDSWDLESGSDMSDYAEDNCVKEESYEAVKSKMEEYMEQMDKELAATTIGDSFEKKNGDTFDDIESFQPVDIDVNALKNILESYKAQLGDAGPSTNMLGPMGLHLSRDDD